MSEHLLLLEDEPSLARNLLLNLRAEGYTVDHAEDIASARSLIEAQKHDLYLFDWMLPDGSGCDLCAELRHNGEQRPICMLTARTSTDDIVAGLEAGADDFIGKPFALEELLGRLSALLRRAQWTTKTDEGPVRPGIFSFGSNSIDLSTGLGTGHDEQEIRLTALELRLLRYLIDHAGKPVSRNELLHDVWDVADPDRIRSRSVDTFMARLRKYFEPRPSQPVHILTEHGTGYRFVG